MSLAHIRTLPYAGGWLAALTLMAFAALAGGLQATASAQVTADPDYWRGTPERRATVNRLVYSQSPQTIPAGYDPVREAEEILRQRYRSLPPTNPQARPLWNQTANLTRTAGLSPALRTLGTIGLAAGAFELGWKIGSGINAKFLTIEVPEPAPWNPSAPQQIAFRNSGSSIYTGLTMPYDGWLWQWWLPYPAQTWKAFWVTPTGNGTELGCPTAQNPTSVPEGFSEAIGAPHPNCGAAGNGGGDGGVAHAGVLPEGGLGALTPIQDYTDQPFDKQSWPGTPPPQTTVEQSIETELDKPENELLRDWLNYQLGSPGQTDPTGIGPPNASQQVLDDTATLVDSEHTQTRVATGTEIVRSCQVPLWHYTSAAAAASIYAVRAISVESGGFVGAPDGAYASTMTPVEPGWTQQSLSYHLFSRTKPVDGWVLMCSNENPAFRPVGIAMTPPDYWYAPSAIGTSVPIQPVAWGLNPMPPT